MILEIFLVTLFIIILAAIRPIHLDHYLQEKNNAPSSSPQGKLSASKKDAHGHEPLQASSPTFWQSSWSSGD